MTKNHQVAPGRRVGIVASAALVTLLSVTAGLPALGHDAANDPVIVAIPDEFPLGILPNGPHESVVGIILREPGATDIIVLNPRRGATPPALRTALGGLDRSRSDTPDPEKGLFIVVRAPTPSQSGQGLEALAAALQEVRAQPRSQIGNLGQGRWLEFSSSALPR